MLPPKRSLVVRILAARPRKHNSGGLPPRSFVLFSVRRQAEAGLLRDGGMTTAEVSRYIRELRLEAEQEVVLRGRKSARCGMEGKVAASGLESLTSRP
jgi:hypothetical protein